MVGDNDEPLETQIMSEVVHSPHNGPELPIKSRPFPFGRCERVTSVASLFQHHPLSGITLPLLQLGKINANKAREGP